MWCLTWIRQGVPAGNQPKKLGWRRGGCGEQDPCLAVAVHAPRTSVLRREISKGHSCKGIHLSAAVSIACTFLNLPKKSYSF